MKLSTNFMFEELNTLRESRSKLEDDLEWHAKLFVLRLMVDTASKDRDKRKESQDKLTTFWHMIRNLSN